MMGTLLRIWARVQISIMEEHDLNTFDNTFVNAEIASIRYVDMHVVHVMNAILLSIIGSSFSILMVVRGNDNDLLAELTDTHRQLIDHDTEAADS